MAWASFRNVISNNQVVKNKSLMLLPECMDQIFLEVKNKIDMFSTYALKVISLISLIKHLKGNADSSMYVNGKKKLIKHLRMTLQRIMENIC